MAELKTKQNNASVDGFIASIEDDVRRNDCLELIGIMREVTGAPPRMWGANIVGFGNYRYRYASGREGDWFYSGFSPRKQNLTLYIMSGFKEAGRLLEKIGKHKTGKSCLYIKSLKDIDREVLKDLIRGSIESLNKQYG